MRTSKRTRLTLLAGVATAALMQPAMALDAQAFIDRVTDVYGQVGYDFTFGPATLDGDTVTVDGVTVGFNNVPEFGEPLTFDTELTFNGVVELPDGGYTAESLTLPDIDTEIEAEPSGRVTLSDILVEDLYVPGGDTVSALAMLQLVGTMSTGPLTVTRDGAKFLSIESMQAGSSFTPEQGTEALTDLSSQLTINGLWLDLSTVKEEDAEAGAIIDGLGLSTISGDITQSLNWSMADGHLVMDEFLFDFDELGALNLVADVTGVTPAMLDKLYAMQAQAMASEPASSEAQAAQMMAGMEMLQGISLVGASVRYDDASLAGRLLDFFAEQQGIERVQFVEGLKAMLPAMLAGTGVPALNDLVVPPVSAFLDDPQSLEIKLQPASPTTLLVLTAAASNPAGLISALGLAITANTAAD
ncbi:hypothetical protein VW29_17330 [Devosia limi DSM 17137]|uniref:DUF945 domain-containing protein n=1 Tax=Devosia limi DSM 17137 TaxID=1121477 RepID=A0A0F5LAW3_9HYPH|nr:hypothetical protein [Devosia limi]KKB79334.1 hypothetical protein VW29_17330 [Devosia limi DSM 17137]SHF29715.1 hypothetical protein SAMN02745223_02255 [Devosia limi DSM 17137]